MDALREPRFPLSLRRIHLIASHKLANRRLAHVALAHASEQVIEHALAQRAVGDLQMLDPEFGERRRYDGEAPGDDRRAVLAQSREVELVDFSRLDEQSAELVERCR